MEQNGPGSCRERSSIRNRESAPGMIPFEYYDRATRDNLPRERTVLVNAALRRPVRGDRGAPPPRPSTRPDVGPLVPARASAEERERRRRPPIPAATAVSMSRVHQRRHREPVVRDPRLLALVEVPALLARDAVARQRGLGRVLELYVDHDDRGGEDALVRVLDGVGDVEDLLADHHVVDPDLPQLAAAVVHVRVRDAPRSEERRVGKEW